MEGDLLKAITTAASAMRWMGKYQEGMAFAAIAKLMKLHDIQTIDELTEWVAQQELNKAKAASEKKVERQ